MRIFIKYLSLFINLLFVIFLLLSGLSTRLSPEKNLLLPYFGFVFPIFFAINFFFVIFWTFRRKWFALISFVSLLLLFELFYDLCPFPFLKKSSDKQGFPLSLLTYNISMFGEERKVEEILSEIESFDADVVCLQEFGFYTNGKVNRGEVLERLRWKYPFKHLWYKNQRKDMEYGVATFSKFPIIKKEKLYYPSQYNISIFSDIVVGLDTVRVFNNHLESTKFSLSEKKEVRQISETEFSTSKTMDLTERLSKKMGKAFRIRARQADVIAYEILKSPYRTIVCGDFNDMPVSYVYRKIRGKQKDLFVSSAAGFDYTFKEGIVYLRIDHILISPDFTPVSCEIKHVGFSDHDPVFGRMMLN